MRWRHRAEDEACGVANVRTRAARLRLRILAAASPVRESSPAPRDALKHGGHFLEPAVKLGDGAVARPVAVCGSALQLTTSDGGRQCGSAQAMQNKELVTRLQCLLLFENHGQRLVTVLAAHRSCTDLQHGAWVSCTWRPTLARCVARVAPAALRVDKQSRRRPSHRTTPTAMARSRYSLAPQATPAKGTK